MGLGGNVLTEPTSRAQMICHHLKTRLHSIQASALNVFSSVAELSRDIPLDATV